MKLIDKDAVVAQANIELTNCRLAAQEGILTEFGKGKLEGLEGIVDFLNTLEVKEMDLEKEIDNYLDDNFYISETWGIFSEKTENEINRSDLEDIAKHFFELGLKINKL